ncbi:6-deoxyerythronolide-B synthase EryA1 [Durusdinium trenchii]|uniref:Modules 1 and 2 (DEBS 1) (6-deoxyerythronolide B synthase I) (Erythronolide synthase) (ORF C) n=1 Tax=Durusdinium trenchii TaxID=1381693 RepID=A0ABP0P9W4_9DINO
MLNEKDGRVPRCEGTATGSKVTPVCGSGSPQVGRDEAFDEARIGGQVWRKLASQRSGCSRGGDKARTSVLACGRSRVDEREAGHASGLKERKERGRMGEEEENAKLEVRLARFGDQEGLVRLEEWMNATYRVGEQGVSHRLERSTETGGRACGALVMVEKSNSVVCGVLYFVVGWEPASYAEIFDESPDPDGDTAFWVHLIVAPQQRVSVSWFHSRARAYFAAEHPSVKKIKALTHCSAFADDDHGATQGMSEYVANATTTDRNLYFHSSRGAVFRGLVTAYNPRDVANNGCAVVMEYTNNTTNGSDRSRFASTESDITLTSVDDMEEAHPFSDIEGPKPEVPAERLQELVAQVLGQPVGDDKDAAHLPWFELGFDSITLMELHAVLETELAQKLNVAFLFQINTLGKLVAYFAPRANAQTVPRVELHAGDESAQASDQGGQDDEEEEAKSTSSAGVERESVVVYGVGLRFPNAIDKQDQGDIESLDDFWHALQEDDCKLHSYHTLGNRNRFDVTSFSKLISDEQARSIPLMQRLAMETALQAFQDGPPGYVESIGRNVGVFVGAWDQPGLGEREDVEEDDDEAPFADDTSNHHAGVHMQQGPKASVHAIAGFSGSILANRISFLFDLRGPSVVVDTACSSSLVAVDMARNAIMQGQCKAAIVIGVNVVDPTKTSLLKQASFLSPSGACFAFDERADGYVRSEGCGALLLGQSQAGITSLFGRARIKGSAVNQDGQTVNLHAPNPESQARLVTQALRSARITPDDISFVQTHGTGTKLGDPIEAYGLQQVFGANKRQEPVFLAAVKAQFGHMEGAAGMIGLIAAIASLQQRLLPGNKRLGAPNQAIPFHQYDLELVGKESVSLPRDTTIHAGISSFGFGGTNAHVVLASLPWVRDSFAQRQKISWVQRSIDIPFQPFLQQRAVIVEMQASTNKVLQHHRVANTPVVPGAFLVAMVSQFHQVEMLADVRFLAMLPLPSTTSFKLEDRLRSSFAVLSKSGNPACTVGQTASQASSDLRQAKFPEVDADDSSACLLFSSAEGLYGSIGNRYQPIFQAIQAVWTTQQGVLLGRIELPNETTSQTDLVSLAVLIDAAAHVCFAALPLRLRLEPVYASGYDKLFIQKDINTSAAAWCKAQQTGENTFNWVILDNDNQVLLHAQAFSFGFFSSRGRALAFHDVWEAPDPTASRLSIDEADAVLDFATVEALHATIKASPPQAGERVLVVAHSPGHRGYLRSLAKEYQQTHFHLIPQGATHWFAGEPELDARGLVRRIKPFSESLLESKTAGETFHKLKDSAAYLITGGAGALGSRVAQAILDRKPGAVVVLVGRSAGPPHQDLSNGTHYFACDVSDRSAVQKLRGDLETLNLVVSGIFHCAGVLDNATIPNLHGDFGKVFKPKIVAAKVLDGVFSGLDFFTLFSSVTAGFGASGQANYAAANAELDAFASHRSSTGRQTLCVRWGPWADVGMAGTFAHRWERMGFSPLDPDLAVEALFSVAVSQALEEDPVLTIANIDASYMPDDAYVAHLRNATVQQVQDPLSVGASHSARDMLLAVARDIAGDAVKHLTPDTPWREAGFDSLSMVEFRNLVQDKLGNKVVLQETVLFDYPTPRELAAFIEAKTHNAGMTDASAEEQNLPVAESRTIAVTGTACRLPGGVTNPDEFWELLCSGKDAISSVPPNVHLGAKVNPKVEAVWAPWMQFPSTHDETVLSPDALVGISGFGFGGTNAHVIVGPGRSAAAQWDASGAVGLHASNSAEIIGWRASLEQPLTYQVDFVPVSSGDFKSSRRHNVETTEAVAAIVLGLTANDSQVDLTFVTRNCRVSPSAAAIWGMVRSIRLERPAWTLRLHDIEVVPESEQRQATFPASDQELEILQDAQGNLSAPRVAPSRCLEPYVTLRAFRDKDAQIILTGGSGGIAQAVCQGLLDAGFGNILMLSRSGNLPSQLSEDARVSSLSCDVTQRAQVERVASAVTASNVTILHAAGILNERSIDEFSVEWVQQHMEVKVSGARHFLDAFPKASFVAFSSSSALFGMKQGAAYAAANAALDALMQSKRREQGSDARCLSILWDIWAETGMAHDRNMASTERGLSTDHATQLLIGALDSPLPLPASVLAIRADWSRLQRSMPAHVSLLAEVAGTTSAVAAVTPPPPSAAFGTSSTDDVQSLAIRLQTAPLETVEDWLVAQAVRFVDMKSLSSETPWQQSGFDSLSMTEFISQCNAMLGLDSDQGLGDTAMFDHPTPVKLAQFLQAELSEMELSSSVSKNEPVTEEFKPSPTRDVAVVGMAFRFPGSANNHCAKGLWDFLCGGGDAMQDAPPGSRFEFPQDSSAYVRRGGFLHEDFFTATMTSDRFKMSDAETKAIDPHQRLALQIAAEALDQSQDADLSTVGVFVAAQNTEHATLQSKNPATAYSRLKSKCGFVFPRDAPIPLREIDGPLHAGVSSFGFGGTNGHVILASAPPNRRANHSLHSGQVTVQDAFTVTKVDDSTWVHTLPKSTFDVICNHRVGPLPVLPATTYIELINPRVDMKDVAAYELHDLKFSQMLFLNPSAQELQLSVEITPSNQVTIADREGKTLATMSLTQSVPAIEPVDLGALQAECLEELVAGPALYDNIANHYRGPFQGLTSARTNSSGSILLGQVSLSPGVTSKAQPSVWLDVASHVALAALPAEERRRPVFAEAVKSYYSASSAVKQLASSAGSVWTVVKRKGGNVFDMTICDAKGAVLAQVNEFSFGFFQPKHAETKQRKVLLSRDVAVPLRGDQDRVGDPRGFSGDILDEENCKSLHRAVKQILPLRGPLRVILRTPDQRGYLACLKREFPNVSILGLDISCADLAGSELPELTGVLSRSGGNLCITERQEIVSQASTSRIIHVEDGGLYVVTGGRGALGQHIANALMERGAGSVLLLGRSALQQESIGNRITYFKCDITQVAEVRRVLAPHLTDIKGVFHCAGVLSDGTVGTLTEESFDRVFAPKLGGAHALWQVLGQSNTLKFLALFSSIASSIGSSGQANYGAANAALDSFAEQLDDARVVSIRWGPWSKGGMAAGSAAMANKFERMGLQPLTPSQALEAMFDIPRGESVVTICDFKPTDSPLEDKGNGTHSDGPRDAVELTSLVLDVAREVNPVSSSTEWNRDESLETPWRDAGLDSLSMVEFRNILESRLHGSGQVDLDDTVLFDYPTPKELISWLKDTLKLPEHATPQPKPQVMLPTVAKLQDPPHTAQGELAVVGAACRLPGNVDSLESFWEVLCSGSQTLGAIPETRFDYADVFDPTVGEPGKIYTNQGAFLSEAELFPKTLFGISERELAQVDPQQRLALIVAQEALASAEMLPKTAQGSFNKRIGVYVGVMTNDWAKMCPGHPTPFTAAGWSHAVLANRISFLLGLEGPSMSIDTACSSSLVALDTAAAALRRGDCDAAVVIGVNMILSVDLFVEECAARMLSPRGRCSTFSKEADGYARGEGCVGLVLCRQNWARERSMPALGVVRATAINQDGKSANLTSPNGRAQQEVVRQALGRANVSPHQVSYVETHGTGTALGDPLEVGALAKVFAGRQHPLVLGAVKSVMGHGEGAAGLTGLLKALLCLHFEKVPGNFSLQSRADLNPKVEKVALEAMVFPTRKTLTPLPADCVAGVSSFGFGGTNAHVLVSRSSGGGASFSLAHQRRLVEAQRVHLEPVPWKPVKVLPHFASSLATFREVYQVEAFGWDHFVPGHVLVDMLLHHAVAEAKGQPRVELSEVEPRDILLRKGTSAFQVDLEEGTLVAPSDENAMATFSMASTSETPSCDLTSAAEDSAWPQTRLDPQIRAALARAGWRQGVWRSSSVTQIGPETCRLDFSTAEINVPSHSTRFLLDPYVVGEALHTCAFLSIPGLRRSAAASLPSLAKVASINVLAQIPLPQITSAVVTPDRVVLFHKEMCVATFEGVQHAEKNHLFGETPLLRTTYVPRAISDDSSRVLPPSPSVPTANALPPAVIPETSLDDLGDSALQRLCRAAIQSAVKCLGGKSFSPQAPELRLAYARWLSAHVGPECASSDEPLLDTVEAAFMANVRGSLESIMRGEVGALDVLFADPALTTRLYSESTPSLACNTAIAQAVKEVMRVKPPGAVIRILELGAGTGGTTMHILEHLDRANTEYFFTDISEYFLRAAATEKFPEWDDVLRYRMVDIERSLKSQDLAEEQFDIMIASNIIHATKDLTTTLTNVCKLLRPGGLFLLNEATVSTAFLDATFAMTSGWWRFHGTDASRMQDSGPLLDPAAWSNLLHSLGFADTSVLHRAAQGQVVFASTRSKGSDLADLEGAASSRKAQKVSLRADDLEPLGKALRHVFEISETASCEIFVCSRTPAGGAQPMFEVLQAFAKSSSVETLVVVTQRDLFPMHGAVVGAGRSLIKELGSSAAKSLLFFDLAAGQSESQAVALLEQELRATSRRRQVVSQVRIRDGERFEAEARPVAVPLQRAGALRGTYIIFGGLGGLGLVTGKWLLQRGLKHLVLVSRSGKLRGDLASSTRERELLDEILAWPQAVVRTYACDVTKTQEIERVLDLVACDVILEPVHGLVQSAGVLRNAILNEMTWTDHVEPVLTTKVNGAMAMHEISQRRGLELDHFVMYSSAASLFGSEGQANHAAANTVLDDLVRLRARQGLASSSVQWGGWLDIGAAADSDVARSSITERGMGLITLEQGLAGVELAFSAHMNGQVFGLTPVCWSRFALQETDTKFLRHFASPSATTLPAESAVAQPVTKASDVQQQDTAQVLSSLLAECGISSMEESFEDQGLDSLTSIELIGLVRSSFGIKLTPTFYLDIPNGEALLRQVESHLGVPAAQELALEEVVDTSATSWIEPLFPPSMRLFCFAYAGGHPNVFAPWMNLLPASVQLCPVSMPGYGKQTAKAFWSSVPELAAHVHRGLPLDRPYALLGSCLGAIVSFEVARAIQADAAAGVQQPQHLFAVACSAPHEYSQALRLLYSNRLRQNKFFVPSDEQQAVSRFSDLSKEDREFTVNDLHSLGFFKDDETLANLIENEDYFEHVMG